MTAAEIDAYLDALDEPRRGTLADDLAGYRVSKGSFQFPVDEPLPEPLLRRLIEVRMAEVFGDGT